MALTWRKLNLYLLMSWVLHTSGGVRIASVQNPITAEDTDTFVTLPCNFTTSTYETPQISWYRLKERRSRRVMIYDVNNHLKTYDEYKGRVSRGNKGDLVLIKPTVYDSGVYSCEVEVDNETPNWAKQDLTLNVTSVLCQSPQKTNGKIRANDTDHFVTLPCNYSGTLKELPSITWYRHLGEHSTQVMTVDTANRLLSSAEYKGRVSRGDKWDLVLSRPTVQDTAVYICEVKVKRWESAVASSTVTLSVRHSPISQAVTSADFSSTLSVPVAVTLTAIIAGIIIVPVTLLSVILVWPRIRQRCTDRRRRRSGVNRQEEKTSATDESMTKQPIAKERAEEEELLANSLHQHGQTSLHVPLGKPDTHKKEQLTQRDSVQSEDRGDVKSTKPGHCLQHYSPDHEAVRSSTDKDDCSDDTMPQPTESSPHEPSLSVSDMIDLFENKS